MTCFLTNTTQEAVVESNTLRDVVLLGMYGITAVFAVGGNLIVCTIVFWKSIKMKRSTRILVGNLAISDILGGLTIPLQWLFCSEYVLSYPWFEFLCALVKSLQVLSFYMSSLIMMLIAMERYQAITKPFDLPFRSLLYVSLTWIVTTIFVATSMGSAKIFEYFGHDCIICCRIVLKFTEPFNSDSMRTQRVWGIWIGQYVFPLMVTAVLYGIIIRDVCFRTNVASVQRGNRDVQNRRLVIMLMIVVIVFAVCWLPLHTLNFIDYVIKNLEQKVNKQKGTTACNESTLYFVLYWFGVSSCCYNPFIYWWLNDEFRKKCRSLITCSVSQTPSRSVTTATSSEPRQVNA